LLAYPLRGIIRHDKTKEVYEYLHDLLGVTEKDLEIHEEVK